MMTGWWRFHSPAAKSPHPGRPFKDFDGGGRGDKPERAKLKVMVSVFGRSRPWSWISGRLDSVKRRTRRFEPGELKKIDRRSRSDVAKKITGSIKLQDACRRRNLLPPFRPRPWKTGLNIMEFCKRSHARPRTRREKSDPLIHGVCRTPAVSDSSPDASSPDL